MVSKLPSDADKEAVVPLQQLSSEIGDDGNLDKEGNNYNPRQTPSPLPPVVDVPAVKLGWRRYGGLTFALLCSLFFSGTVLIAKVLHQSHGHHPIVVTMYRYGCGIFLPSIPVAIYFQKFAGVQVFESLIPITERGNWKNLVAYLMQGVLGCSATIFRFISFEFLPIADSTVVFSSYTVVVTILANVFLGEPCGVVSVLLAGLTAVGVVVIARPPLITGEAEFNVDYLKGTMFALLALLCTAFFILLMRKIRKTHFALMMLVGGGWGIIEPGVLAVLMGVFTIPQNQTDFILFLGLAVLTFLGQTCFVLAVKYENAGPIAIARTTEAIYAFLWQFLFLGIIPDLISVLGGTLVITAVVTTGYCKYLESLPADNPTRRRLRFLLR